MEKLSFRAGEVEGPLDLILTLDCPAQAQYLDDIEISTLVEQYTAAVREMEEADLEVGSEFIEMAARLVYIKTVELLPKHEKDEDPRRELTGQLLEYQACRQAAALLGAQSRDGQCVYPTAHAAGCGPHPPAQSLPGTAPCGIPAVPWARANGSNPRRQRCSVRWWQPGLYRWAPALFPSCAGSIIPAG